MKRARLLGMVLMVCMTGCGQMSLQGEELDNAQQNTVVYSGSGEETQQTDTSVPGIEEQEKDSVKEFSFQDVIKLAEKHAELTVEDFEPYLNLEEYWHTGFQEASLDFIYNGKDMILKVVADNSRVTSGKYASAIDIAFVYHKDFFDSDFMKKNTYVGPCADIRSGNIERILSGVADMSDYLSMQLPEGLLMSSMKYWMGGRGGCSFIKDSPKDSMLTASNTGMHAGKQGLGGIEIWRGTDFWQSVGSIRELPSKDVNGVELLRREVKTDDGNAWYIAYTEVDGATISYCIYLNKNIYTEEEFLAMTDTVQFKEHAFY